MQPILSNNTNTPKQVHNPDKSKSFNIVIIFLIARFQKTEYKQKLVQGINKWYGSEVEIKWGRV